MILIKLIEALRSRPVAMKRLALVGLALLVLWDALLLDKGRAHSALERAPGWWSVFGLAGCAAIVVFAKWLGSRGVSTREDRYE